MSTEVNAREVMEEGHAAAPARTTDCAAAADRGVPRRAITAVIACGLLGALGVVACGGNPAPEPAPTPSLNPEEVAESVTEAAVAAGMEDEEVEEVEEADEQAQRTVAGLDEATRREFLELFGNDPLGLVRKPANALRYEIPLETNRAVEWWIDYYQNRIPDRFALYLERAGRFESMIRSRLREEGLPGDLLYLCLIESGMNPNAYSRARAAGLWQFIASTGRMYDLEVSYWVDDRRDPVLATEAAIAHLSDLYDEFGSWYLAAAAYNAGAGRVRWGINRTGSRSFWDLADARVLRRETRDYVPKIIAAALIARNPAKYGFEVEPHARFSYEEVTVPDATSFDVIARAAGVDEETIRELNPRYRRQVTPPGQESMVRIPVERAERFTANFEAIPASERVSWLRHTVTRGQTLTHVARRYGTSVQAIRNANDGIHPRRLQVGQTLLVPRVGGSYAAAGGSPSGPTTVVVRRGDTLWAIARRHNVSTAELMAWNDLGSSVIRPGDRLEVRR